MTRRAAGPPGSLPDGTPNPLSIAVRAGDFVFVSGLMAKDADGRIAPGGIAEQTRVAMERLKRAVEEAGCSMDDVVKCTVWLARAEDFPAFNAVYAAYFKPPMPARSTMRAELLMAGALIEIEAICHRPPG